MNVDIEDISRFEIWHHVCLVHIIDRRPTFISKKVFKQHFADYRIKSSQSLKVVEVDRSLYRVLKPVNRFTETVTLNNSNPSCSCQDYQSQSTHFGDGKAYCINVYAVLRYLGYQRLIDILTVLKQR